MKRFKNLLNTPTKAITTGVVTLLVILLLGFSIFSGAKTIAEGQAIGVENARNFAFADSGVDPAVAQYVKTEFDFEQGHFVYEVEFIANGVEYDYWIKANDGSVVKKKTNFVNRDAVPVQMNTSIEEARDIALADAGLSVDNVTITKESFDEDDGIYVYEIKFHSASNRFEYDIDVNSGQIVEKSQDGLAVIARPQTPAESAPVETTPAETNTTETAKRLTVEQAKAVVLKDSNVAANAAKFIKVELDNDDGRLEYDIEFSSSTHKYEYEIDAFSGRIKEKEVEAIKKASTSTNTTKPSTGTSTSTGSTNTTNSNKPMSQAKAKEVVLNHAKVSASQATFTEIELDRDDNRWEYEIDFRTSTAKYEYEIDAVTGKILDVEVERIKSSSSTSTYIGTEKAKSIALSHAKLSTSQVRFEKVKLEKDDGVYYYEVEFLANGLEYEYEINAKTGKIVDWEIDD